MSLFKSMVRGFTAQVGAEVAKQSLDSLTKAEREEEERKAKAKQKRMLAAVVVGISALGLLFLSGWLTQLFKWLLGALFLGGVAGGTYYLARNRIRALKAKLDEKREKKIEAKTSDVKQQTVEEQLAELKKRRG